MNTPKIVNAVMTSVFLVAVTVAGGQLAYKAGQKNPDDQTRADIFFAGQAEGMELGNDEGYRKGLAEGKEIGFFKGQEDGMKRVGKMCKIKFKFAKEKDGE